MIIKQITLIIILLFAFSNIYAEVSISGSTFKKLQSIENLIANEQLNEAESQLNTFLQSPPSEDIDKAYLFLTGGMLYLQKDSYNKAGRLIKQAHELNVLPQKTTLQMLQTLASLSMQNENNTAAIKYYKEYIELSPEPNKHMYLGLGTAYFHENKYKNAIQILKKAKNLFVQNKSIYLMLFSSYYELKQLRNASDILEQMVRIWPTEKLYWLQLTSVYIEQEKYTKALEIMQITLSKGFELTESEILQYSYVLYEKNLPYKSAIIIKNAMAKGIVEKNQKNYELLSSMYQEAKERNKAITALKEASRYTKDGKNYLYIAQLYFEQKDQFKNVIKYAKIAIEKGIKQTGNAHMLIAVAYDELKQTDKAKEHLKQALKYPKTKKSAQQWLRSL